jgi:hypothetical protein
VAHPNLKGREIGVLLIHATANRPRPRYRRTSAACKSTMRSRTLDSSSSGLLPRIEGCLFGRCMKMGNMVSVFHLRVHVYNLNTSSPPHERLLCDIMGLEVGSERRVDIFYSHFTARHQDTQATAISGFLGRQVRTNITPEKEISTHQPPPLNHDWISPPCKPQRHSRSRPYA